MVKYIRKLLIIAGWLVVWQLAAAVIDNTILIAGPIETAAALADMVQKELFWQSIAFSSLRIVGGFLAGSAAGILLAYPAYRKPIVGELISPIVTVLKAAPVASFIILALIWFGSARISFVISFLVVFPMLYLNTLEGLRSIDGKLLEMAEVFRIPTASRLRYIELPGVCPFLTSAFELAFGMSWKSGVAAELIGRYKLSIGNQLYMDKITLNTAGIFAWTFVIILISWVFGRIFLGIFRKLTTPRSVSAGSAGPDRADKEESDRSPGKGERNDD